MSPSFYSAISSVGSAPRLTLESLIQLPTAVGLGIWIKTIMHVVSGNESAAYLHELDRWGIAGSAIILATNMTVTSLITGRLMYARNYGISDMLMGVSWIVG